MDANSHTQQQVLDPAAIEGLRDLQEEGEPDILGELVEMYVTDSEQRLAAVREAVREARPVDVERAAHALAGGSAVFGADAVVAVCRRLQSAGHSGDLTEAPALIDRLLGEYESLRAALAREVANGA